MKITSKKFNSKDDLQLDILDIAESKGKEIGRKIMQKYDEADISLNSAKIEKEIWERALHSANVFFLENEDAKFDEKIISDLISKIQTFTEKDRNILKLKTEELLANVIKFYAIDFLMEFDIII
jgi:hypothetical protein